MKLARLFGLSLCLSISLTAAAADAPKAIHLASVEWMPFSGKILPNDGISIAIASEAAKSIGSSVTVDYFIWKDAVAAGESDPAFAGYVPEFYTEELAHKTCYLSGSIGSSTTGIAYLKEAPVKWKTLSDLASLKIGVVDGYSNGEALDAAIKQGKQQVELSSSDTNNIRKLVTKKVQAIVVDKLVLRYMTMKSPARDSIVFDEKTLVDQTLHVCFKRTPAGKSLQEAFDAALKKIDVPKLESAYFKSLEQSAK